MRASAGSSLTEQSCHTLPSRPRGLDSGRVSENHPDRMTRASDADRERVVELLRDAASEGRLDLDEFEDRMGTAWQARTYGELEPLTNDLPEVGLAPRQQEQVVRAHGSKVRREGRWPVPRRLVVETTHGAVRLDLTKAVVLASEVEVAITATHSSVVVLVPTGTEVIDDGVDAAWSSVNYQNEPEFGGPRLQVRLTGTSTHSSVKVRTATIFDIWAQRIKARWRRFLRPS